jgi:lipoprotein-releasing system permease protein
MYKLLLCWRYLLTRYLALACIISVMLGVATLIVVNSVMGGFSQKLQDRLHGLLSDVDIEARTYNGFLDPRAKMERIRQDPYLGPRVEAMAATIEVFAMLQFRWNGEWIMRPVRVIGVDYESRSRVGGFADYLTTGDPSDPRPTFDLGPKAKENYERIHWRPRLMMQPLAEPAPPGQKPPPEPPPEVPDVPHGALVGWSIAHFRRPATHADEKNKDIRALDLGDDVILTTVSGVRLQPIEGRFAVAGYFKSEMSEYDGNYVFVPLDYLQRLRSMEDRATAIQIKLKDERDTDGVQKALQTMFPVEDYQVSTWRQKQGPLLGAIAVEKGLLNILLFLIIAVAGFGILAIFTMIVVEKTRDIGILKALGASNAGVMNIFLGYGLLLGVVGAAFGSGLGLLLTYNLNTIERQLSHYTGTDIFPRDIYYFDRIPTDIQPMTILLVNLGAVGIAVLFSVLPALRAALLHPVRALRYE